MDAFNIVNGLNLHKFKASSSKIVHKRVPSFKSLDIVRSFFLSKIPNINETLKEEMNFNPVKVITKKQKEITLRMIDSSEAQLLLNSMIEIAEHHHSY